MLSDNPDRAGRLMTYDRGLLEIMSPSMAHESDKSLLGQLVKLFCLHHRIDICSAASTTFRRSDLRRGFEADESFYIQNEARIRGKREIDLSIDPPPDLVIEVETTRSAINKLALYAEIGVPEVWRYDGQSLWLGQLNRDQYQQIEASVGLGGFPVAEAVLTLQAVGTASETELIRRFVDKL